VRFYVLLALAACSHPDTGASVDAAADSAIDAAPTWPVAMPLSGCSYSFTGAFRIGGTPYLLQVDTGSYSLGVAAIGCTTCTTDGVTRLYAPGSSATDLGSSATFVYDDGGMQWTGEAYRDDVGVDGAAAAMQLYAIASETDFFYRGECGEPDGIVGMQGDAGLPAMLATAGMPDVFAMHECRSKGTLWLGGYDATATTGSAVTAAMPDDFSIGLTDVAIGGSSVGLPASAYGQAIVDSGGPSIFVPQAAYDAITGALQTNQTFISTFGSAGWFAQPNCVAPSLSKLQLDAALPALSLSFGSAVVQLAATDSYLIAVDSGTSTYYCPALDASPTFLDLGNSLIRSQIVVFDRDHRVMSIAPTAPCI
jgi:Eukaryotic aspartyl protease